MTREITLTQGFVALVDDADFESLNRFKWGAHVGRTGHVYATRQTPRSEGHRPIKMHRQILGVTDPKIKVDHVNHNTLDNQRLNLRETTHKQNMENRSGAARGSHTGQLGVSLYKRTGRYRAHITHHKRQIHLGYFDTIQEASAAASAARAHYFTHSTV